MKKGYWVYLIIVFIIGGGISYFYLQNQSQSQAVVSYDHVSKGEQRADPTQTEEKNKPAAKNLKNEKNSNNAESCNDKNYVHKKSNNENCNNEGQNSKGIVKIKQIYAYRQNYKDPFADYRISKEKEQGIENLGSEPLLKNKKPVIINEEKELNREEKREELTVEELKSVLPFKLTGIISNEQKNLAIINTKTGSKIIREKDLINGFEIVKILEDGIMVSFKELIFKIGMESDLGAS